MEHDFDAMIELLQTSRRQGFGSRWSDTCTAFQFKIADAMTHSFGCCAVVSIWATVFLVVSNWVT
eukprot:1434238-Rhodomonas_salina.1